MVPAPDQKNGKTLITGIGSYFYPEPRGVTDTPGYSAAVSGNGGANIQPLESKKSNFRTPKKLEKIILGFSIITRSLTMEIERNLVQMIRTGLPELLGRFWAGFRRIWKGFRAI